jgi:hypothetical protein
MGETERSERNFTPGCLQFFQAITEQPPPNERSRASANCRRSEGTLGKGKGAEKESSLGATPLRQASEAGEPGNHPRN